MMRLQNIPLRVVLVVPFVLELLVAVGLTAYLSYWYGHEAASNLAHRLTAEVSDRAQDRLNGYLENSVQMTRDHVVAIESGFLRQEDTIKLNQFFYHRLQNLSGTAHQLCALFFVNLSNNQLTAEKLTQDQCLLSQQTEATVRQHIAQTAHLSRGGWQVFTESGDGQPWLTAAYLQPIQSEQSVQGMMGTFIDLQQVSKLLEGLNLSNQGRAFIVDANGGLLASSAGISINGLRRQASIAPSAQSGDRDAQSQFPATRNLDTTTRDAALFLKSRFATLDEIPEGKSLDIKENGRSYFLRITPLEHPKNLKWYLIVVVPKADFIAQLDRKYHALFALLGGAVLGATALGLATAQRITRPILRLSKASQDLMLGKLDAPVKEQTRIAELAVLAHSFNKMTEQLMQSFDQVNLALQESKEKYTTVFRTSPDPIMVTTLPEGTILEVNESFLRLTGYTRQEVIGQTAIKLGLWANLDDRERLMQAIRETGRVHNQEVSARTRQGTWVTALLSSERIELEGKTCLLTVAKDITERKRLEEAFRRSESKLQDVLNSASAAICYFSIDGSGIPRGIYFSAGAQTVFGYPPDLIVSDRSLWLQRVHPEDIEAVIQPSVARMMQGQSFTAEYRYQHPEEGLRWIAADINTRWDAMQNCWLVTSLEFDITARKKAEEALRISEERFRMAFDTAAVGMDIASPSGHLLRVNPALCQMLDYSEAELLQRSFRDVTHPDDLQIDEAVNRRILSGEILSSTFEKRFVRKDGEIVWASLSLALVRDLEQPLFWVAQIQNITERKQFEAALQLSEARFRAVFETAALGIAIADLDGNILEVNDALCRICGHFRSELQQMKLQQIIRPEDLQRWLKLVQELNSQWLDHYELKLRCIRKNGELIKVQLTTLFIRSVERHPLYLVARIEVLPESGLESRLPNLRSGA
jgi:PAS domain S-box-containing protein